MTTAFWDTIYAFIYLRFLPFILPNKSLKFILCLNLFVSLYKLLEIYRFNQLFKNSNTFSVLQQRYVVGHAL